MFLVCNCNALNFTDVLSTGACSKASWPIVLYLATAYISQLLSLCYYITLLISS